MAVGSGIIDVMMMNEADISIAVSSKLVSSDLQAVCDINVADLSSLIYLLLRHGISITKKMQLNLCFSVYKTMLLFGMITYSTVNSSGSATLMIAQVQYLLYNTVFTVFIQIVFGLFYKDIPFHFTHRLSCEYKGNISGIPISKAMILSFLIMGFIEAAFIWVLTLEIGSWVGLEGETVNVNTQQSYVFYFLLFSYCFKAVSRFTHLSLLVFLVSIPFVVIIVPFSTYVTPFEQIDRFLNFPSIFIDFILICMVSACIEYIFGRVYMLLSKSVCTRLNYYLEKEERIIYEYLEDSDNDSDEDNKIEQEMPYYKESSA